MCSRFKIKIKTGLLSFGASALWYRLYFTVLLSCMIIPLRGWPFIVLAPTSKSTSTSCAKELMPWTGTEYFSLLSLLEHGRL